MFRLALIGSILIGIAVIGWQSLDRQEATAPTYRTAPVERGDVLVTVSATGTINPVTSVQVGSQISGIIWKLHADFNTKVKEGMVLAELDPSTFQAQVLQSKANVEKARASLATAEANQLRDKAAVLTAKADIQAALANVEKAKVAVRIEDLNLARVRPLAKQQLMAAQELDKTQSARDQAAAAQSAAEAQVDTARAKLAAAEAGLASAAAAIQSAGSDVKVRAAELEIAEINLSRTKIVSPVDGVVVSRAIDVGQTVAASLSAPTLFVIAKDLTQMQINTSIDEADIGKIQTGQSVRFTVDAYPEQHFNGRVKEVRLGPIVNQNVVTYDCVVAVENPDLKLRPGMTANSSILVAQAEDVLLVPAAALTFKPDLDEMPMGRGGRGSGRGGPGGANGNGSGSGASPGSGSGGPGGRRKVDRSRVWRKRGEDGARVWILVGSELKRVPVKAGLSDGRVTEITSGDLKEEQLVVTGTEVASKKDAALGGSNPFAPQRGGRGMRGAGGGGGGRGR